MSSNPQADASAAEPAPEFGQLRRNLWQQLGRRPLAVMLDSTTFIHAGRALTRGRPDAYDLLDLSALTVAAVFFDHVIVQPDLMRREEIDAVVPSGVMPGLVQELDLNDRARAELPSLYTDAINATDSRKQRHASRWKVLLGRDVDIDQIHAQPTYRLEEYLQAVPALRGDDGLLSRFASQHTVRAEFNDRVAAALALPYLPSSVRLAPASELVKSHNEILKALRQLAGHVTPSQEPTPASSFAAPFLLGVLLDEMASLDQFASTLAQLRDEFSGFRAWLRDHPDRAGWHDRPQSLYAEFPGRLVAALSADAARTTTTTMATVHGAASLTPAAPFMNAAVEIVQAAQGRPCLLYTSPSPRDRS